jgi:hypothetical protein
MTGPFDQDAVDPGTAVTVAGSSSLDDYKPRSQVEAELVAILGELPWLESGDAAMRMALSIATGDPDKAGEQLEARTVSNLKLIGKTHTVTSFSLSRSTFATPENGGCPVFASVEAVDAFGEVFGYSIGGWKPVMQLAAWYKGDKLPHVVQVIGIPTGKGNPAFAYVDA